MRTASGEDNFISGYSEIDAPDGHRWRRDYFDSWGMIFTLKGSGFVLLDGKHHDAASGDLILIAPELKPEFHTRGRWNFLWFHFLIRSHIAGKLDFLRNKDGIISVNFSDIQAQRVSSALHEAHQLEIHRRRGWYELAYVLLESVLLRMGLHLADEKQGIDRRIAQAQDLLVSSPKPLAIEDIARRCGMSRAVFYSEFKRSVGISPRQYREIHHLRYAQSLLENTKMPISAIATQIGMRDQFYFSVCFKRFCGLSPTDYRKRNTKP